MSIILQLKKKKTRSPPETEGKGAEELKGGEERT